MIQDNQDFGVINFLNNKFNGMLIACHVVRMGKRTMVPGLIVDHYHGRQGNIRVKILVGTKLTKKTINSTHEYFYWVKERANEIQNKTN